MSQWIPLYHLFDGSQLDTTRVSHGAYPTVQSVHQGVVRIFFATRDSNHRSAISTMEFRLDGKEAEVTISEAPLLLPGPVGHFDDAGVTPGSVFVKDNRHFLLYTGWNVGGSVPFRNSIGLAEYFPQENRLERTSNGPYLGRSHEDPVNLTYPFFMSAEGKEFLFYGSDSKSSPDKEGMTHVPKVATRPAGSPVDGAWHRSVSALIELDPGQLTISRPSIVPINGGYAMFYSYRQRGEPYQIGMATSADLHSWTRKDSSLSWEALTVGTEPASDTGWAGESRAYPYVFWHQDSLFMLYCGNRFGRTGFGIARHAAPNELQA